MIFKLHYWFLSAGSNAITVLLGVYIQEYTDANAVEIGALYMLMPFLGLVFRPIICSKADREQAHQFYLILSQFVVAVTYLPFVIIPLLGPDIYRGYPRVCWYILLTMKVLGDIAFGGVVCIGDALAINYARRIKTEFSVYRVWGTVSWMVFGIIIGQINEVSFLPKYVPGFMILISSSLLGMTVMWLWPREYFVMKSVTPEPIESSTQTKEEAKRELAIFRSLLPRQVVIRSMRAKLWSLLTCSCFSFQDEDYSEYLDKPNSTKITATTPSIKATTKKLDLESNHNNQIKTKTLSQQDNLKETEETKKATTVDKKTQARILMVLFKRDPRIAAYLLFFVGAGFTMSPIGYVFMSISERCHEEESCNFSQLAGLLQVSMAAFETVLFIYVHWLLETLGRVNLGALAFFLYSIKIIYYTFFWEDMNPYFTLIFEGFRGPAFGIYVTLMVELGYKFANEVQFIIPELRERGYIPKDADSDQLRLSLSSTMQSLVSSAMEGIGRGFGAMICGLILNYHPYNFLWQVIAIITFVMITITLTVSLCDKIFKFELGLDLAAEKDAKRKLESVKLGGLQRNDSVLDRASLSSQI